MNAAVRQRETARLSRNTPPHAWHVECAGLPDALDAHQRKRWHGGVKGSLRRAAPALDTAVPPNTLASNVAVASNSSGGISRFVASTERGPVQKGLNCGGRRLEDWPPSVHEAQQHVNGTGVSMTPLLKRRRRPVPPTEEPISPS